MLGFGKKSKGMTKEQLEALGIKTFEPERFEFKKFDLVSKETKDLSKKTENLIKEDDELVNRVAETSKWFNEIFPDD